MKKSLLVSVFTSFVILFALSANAQFHIASTTGYTANVDVVPLSIVNTTDGCQNGYNYNVKLGYRISFTGTNAPASMYTLQGVLGCGVSTHFFDLPNNGGYGNITSQSRVWTTKKDCATATVQSFSCNLVTLEIEGPGISRRFVTLPAASSVVLPIQLVSFTAIWEQNAVNLKWVTASEENNASFTIERSANGTEWNGIQTIKGAGTSSTTLTYTTTDAAPLIGVSYYRLRQTDIDGKSTYSEVRTVESAANATAKISLYPVPNTGNTINLAGISNVNEYSLTVMNTAGTQLYRTNLSKTSVELPSLNAGLYIVVVKNKVSGESTSFRYVKM